MLISQITASDDPTHIDIKKAKVVIDDDTMFIKIKTNATIPQSGEAGAFGMVF